MTSTGHERCRIIPKVCYLIEPGYYQVGEFGIRLETVLLTVPAQTKVCDILHIITTMNACVRGFSRQTLGKLPRWRLEIQFLQQKFEVHNTIFAENITQLTFHS